MQGVYFGQIHAFDFSIAERLARTGTHSANRKLGESVHRATGNAKRHNRGRPGKDRGGRQPIENAWLRWFRSDEGVRVLLGNEDVANFEIAAARAPQTRDFPGVMNRNIAALEIAA